MHRPIIALFTCLLLTATGIGLVGVAATVMQAPITVAPATAAAAAAVRRFYAAADEALRSGDTIALQTAVTPDYRDHAAPSPSAGDAGGYARFLAELRATCPDCRLTAQVVVLGHDQAAIRVEAQGHRRGMALGVSVDGLPMVWSALDVLRIAGGRVAERWSRGDLLALTQPCYADAPPTPSADPAVLQVARFVLSSGASLPAFTTRETAMLVVETGTLAVQSYGTIMDGAGFDALQVDYVLDQGERYLLTRGQRHTVRNDGPTSAVVLVVALDPIEVLPN